MTIGDEFEMWNDGRIERHYLDESRGIGRDTQVGVLIVSRYVYAP